MLKSIEEKVLDGVKISRKEALFIASLSNHDIFDLFSSANRIREHFRGNTVDLCAIINAKSGACPEDCSYCAQSAKSSAEIKTFRLVEKETIVQKAQEAKEGGARRFCIVTSGKKASATDLKKIAEMVSAVRKLGLLPCATLGLLSGKDLLLLKDAGLERYHNNLETSERFFHGDMHHTYLPGQARNNKSSKILGSFPVFRRHIRPWRDLGRQDRYGLRTQGDRA